MAPPTTYSPKRRRRVLVVDDDPATAEWTREILEAEGYEARCALIGTRGQELFRQWGPDAVVVNLTLPDVDGVELVRRLKETDPWPEIIALGEAGRRIARRWRRMQAGAFYFLQKPVTRDGLVGVLQNAFERMRERAEHQQLKEQVRGQYSFANVVGQSKAMKELFELIESVAASEANILIQGENGTGKELIANAIHHHSGRVRGPFIKINCAAIPHELIESELFGYRKGSFTGATVDKVGLFEMAEGGSLLLDEVGGDAVGAADQAAARAAAARVPADRQRPHGARGLPPDLQHQRRSGAGAARRARARGPVLPHQHDHAAGAAAARADRGHSAHLQPLPGEVQPAVRAVGARHLAGGLPPAHPEPLVGQRARAGERDGAGRAGVQDGRDRPGRPARNRCATTPPASDEFTLPPGRTLAEIERLAIVQTLMRTNWNKQEAAQMLGLYRPTLYSKMRKHKIVDERAQARLDSSARARPRNGTAPAGSCRASLAVALVPNRLASEHSPYLLQHQHNPVDWYPWGDAAFERARAEDRPIFLSVGYSTCHWCHVMEHESFEDAAVAELLNAHFVSIKVDREERPDVDRVYMLFVQATTGSRRLADERVADARAAAVLRRHLLSAHRAGGAGPASSRS